MNKSIVLFLLSIYIISGTELREIIKLPVLFQHFYEHKKLNNEITVVDFLSDHYNSIPHTDNDEARDNQLPFKTIDLTGFFTPAIPSSSGAYIQKAMLSIVKNDTFLYHVNFDLSAYCGKVWQPPKKMIIS